MEAAEIVAAGLAAAVTVILLKWLAGRREEAVQVATRELAEALLAVSLLVVLTVYANRATPELYPEVESRLSSAAAKFEELLNNIQRLAAAVALLDIAVGVVTAGAGSAAAYTALQGYQTLLHTTLGPLEATAAYVGAAMLVSRLLLLIVKLLPLAAGALAALTPLLLVPRARDVVAPVWVVLFALTVFLPLSVANVADVQVIAVPAGWPLRLGSVHVRVEESSGSPVYKPVVLVAFKDSSGNLFVSRVRDGSLLLLPEGNYTALWIAHYWTNFSLHGCCYSRDPGVSCDCYVWPATFYVKANTTAELLVYIPVDLIEEGEGHSGHTRVLVGNVELHPTKGKDYVEYRFSPRELEKGVVVLVRGGAYNLSTEKANATCTLRVEEGAEKPPGEPLDYAWYSHAQEAYEEWVNRVRGGLPPVGLQLNLSHGGLPRMREYSLRLQADNCSAGAILRVFGAGEWNVTHAPTYIGPWIQLTNLSSAIATSLTKYTQPVIILLSATLTLIFTGAALASTVAVSLHLMTSFVSSQFPRPRRVVPRLSDLVHGLRKVSGHRRFRIEVITSSGKRKVLEEKPSILERLDDASRILSESPVPLMLRAAREAAGSGEVGNRLEMFYNFSKLGLRVYEPRLVRTLRGVPGVFEKLGYRVLGYRVPSRAQLRWFRAADNILSTHRREFAEKYLKTLKELVAEDLERYAGRRAEHLIKALEKAKYFDELDRVVFTAVFERKLPSELVSRELKVYPKHPLIEDVIAYGYRFRALEKLESEYREEVRLAARLYTKWARLAEVESNEKWWVLFEKLRRELRCEGH